jgi:hypothetical protein
VLVNMPNAQVHSSAMVLPGLDRVLVCRCAPVLYPTWCSATGGGLEPRTLLQFAPTRP